MPSTKYMQEKIDNEILVDCYDENEQSMSWYYFMQESLEFPFKAMTSLKKANGQIEKKEVTITGLESNEEGFMNNDFYLQMLSGDYISTIRYSQLDKIKAGESTKEALAIWKYWIHK